ncbi:MAG TPA: phosphoglycerate kinase [bacterium]|nr:phosphoglycerate kinase [bacterium]HOL48404.1 phosphoglycerate kinase [bacterium]HPQ18884.1 phosphoglycerate kinase [bacterium]
MPKLTIDDVNLKNKTVLIRVDFNVPLKNGKVTDDTRIRESLPTINKAIKDRAKIILVSHLGRPKGVDEALRLAPVSKRLSELLNKPVKQLTVCRGPEVDKAISEMKPGDIIMLENIRFEKGEEKNDTELSKDLAKNIDVYINDAFAAAHRAHSSTAGITQFVKIAAAGYLLQKEIKYLEETVKNPVRPFCAIIGGAKVSTKISVLKELMKKVDSLVIGGAMAYTFLKAQNINIGNSLVENDFIDLAKELLNEAKTKQIKFVLPIDHIIADKVDNNAAIKITTDEKIDDGWIGVDIGPKTINLIKEIIKQSKTIVWNGPLGVFEVPNFAKGTFEIAKAIADSGAISIIGGGDSVAAINASGVANKITHISTGGGASLEYLEGKELPGIKSLTDK